jgi:multicomponent Na+:H+ antiporter subunit E
MYLYTFMIMFAFWILLSGKFDAFHLTLGILSSAAVSFFSTDLLFHQRSKKGRLREIWRFILYIPWILREIFSSTLHVAYLALHPRMIDMIDPTIIAFQTRLKKDMGRVALANSITLTPGTITIRIEGDKYMVHALSQKSAKGVPGEMEDRLVHVFQKD